METRFNSPTFAGDFGWVIIEESGSDSESTACSAFNLLRPLKLLLVVSHCVRVWCAS